jgi:hypothetical protein
MKKIYTLFFLVVNYSIYTQSIALQPFMEYSKYNYRGQESPYAIEFHPKKELIAISTNDDKVKVINYKQDSIWEYKAPAYKGAPRLSFTPDGSELVFTKYLSGSDIAIIDANTFQLKQNIKVDKEAVNDMVIGKEGKQIITSGGEGTIKVFTKLGTEWELFHEIIVPQSDNVQDENTHSVSLDMSTGESKTNKSRDVDVYFCFQNRIFSSELVSKEDGKERCIIRVFVADVKKNKALYEAEVLGDVKAMQVHPNGKNVLVSTDKELIIYEWRDNQLLRRRSFVDYADAETISIDKSGKYIMLGISNSIKICKWDNENIKLNNDIDLVRSAVYTSFSQDSKYFACNAYSYGTLIWRTGLNTATTGVDNKKSPIIEKKATPNTPTAADKQSVGKCYLFSIGIDTYAEYPVLSNAKKDAQDVKNLLVSKYKIANENAKLLTDKEANSKNILDALNEYVEVLTEDDQLIIYYSGHGHYNKSLDEGYWIPVDAQKGKELDFLPNSTLVKYLKAIPAKHVFLVVDACFSGSLMSSGTRGFLDNVTQFKSRWALTSGRYEVVSDGMEGKNSPFAEYFLKFLKENKAPKFAVSELVNYVKQAVSNNAEQTPWGNAIRNAGDEGGELIFELK